MKTTREIAEKLGCSMTTVRKTMEALGHKPDDTGRGFKYSSDTYDDIVEHYVKHDELTKRFVTKINLPPM
jgi:predicted transcriptional regulator